LLSGTRDEMKCRVNSPEIFSSVDPEKNAPFTAFDFDAPLSRADLNDAHH
jgi:hypothetical protein